MVAKIIVQMNPAERPIFVSKLSPVHQERWLMSHGVVTNPTPTTPRGVRRAAKRAASSGAKPDAS